MFVGGFDMDFIDRLSVSLGEVGQIFLPADLPVLLDLVYYCIIDDFLALVCTAVKIDGLQLHHALSPRDFLLLILRHLPIPRPHLHKIMHILPNEALVIRLVDRVEVVGVVGREAAAIDHLFLLLVDVLEVLEVVGDFEVVLLGLEVDVLELQVVEDGIIRSGERVQKGIELLLGAAIENVVLKLLLLLDHKRNITQLKHSSPILYLNVETQ